MTAPGISRRKAKAPTKGSVEHRSLAVSDIELRDESDGELRFTGFASMTGVAYPIGDMFTETIERGAFKRTLNNENLDVQLLVNHRGLPLARTTSDTLSLTETERGLFVEADLDQDDPDVRSLKPKMQRGDVTEMSFAFRSLDEAWNEDYTHRSLKSVDIHRGDVSIVSYGASPTTTATLRSEAESNTFIADLERRAGRPLPLEFKRQLVAMLTGRQPSAPEPYSAARSAAVARLRLAAVGSGRGSRRAR